MAKLLKLRRGTTTQHSSFTGAEGEVTIDVDKDVPVVHDGSTAGGHPVAAEDLANVTSATIVGRLNAASIPPVNIASGALPTNVTVTTANITNLTVATEDIATGAVTGAKIADSTITNGDVNASAAIAGTKISPDFGSQNVTTTGNAFFGDVTLENAQPSLILNDNNAESDFAVQNRGGTFTVRDVDNAANRFTIASDGTTSVEQNLDVGAGVDVTGNITVSGTVDGVDIAALNTTTASLSSVNGSLANGVTATTQGAGDNSAKVATTAYADTAITNLVASAPAALNTLNELAAAMGDDSNFSTTVTNSLAAKMPLAGGTFTGDVSFDGATAGKDVFFDRSENAFEFQDGAACRFGTGNDLAIYHDGSNSYINEAGTGGLLITSGTTVNIKKDDGAGNTAKIAEFNVDADVELYHAGTKMFETMTNGFKSTDRIYADGGVIGRDATDLFNFINNDRIEVYINDSQEFRFEGDGDFHADGDVIAFSTTIASDERLKENIEIVPDALDKVEALRGVTFDWKRDGKSSAGVIAQEVMGVLPEAVKEVQGLNDNESHLTVNYHALTSILIESIKELSARVKELEAK